MKSFALRFTAAPAADAGEADQHLAPLECPPPPGGFWAEAPLLSRLGEGYEGELAPMRADPAFDPLDDIFMALRDVTHVLQWLAEISPRTGLTWTIELDGNRLGLIETGQLTPELLTALDGLRAPVASDEPDSERVKRMWSEREELE
jgi:hypothetical protein